jgi:4-hydroxy-tetrahydrodipicolinate synthase
MERRANAPTDSRRLSGLFAAVVTPTHDDGRLDLRTFDRLVDLAVESGASGICIAGATGEYPHFEVEDRKRIIRQAAGRLPRDRGLLVGIGAPSMRLSIELGEAAMAVGSRALLLPMPMFFRYEQQDLEAFCAHVSGTLRAPGLDRETMIGLLRKEEFLVGVKDSSGEIANVSALSRARGDLPWSLLVGDDHLLRDGLLANWDGGISGVAAFCPELLVAIYRAFTEGRPEDTARLQNLLDEVIAWIAAFPTPWGIKIGLAARGIETGPLPVPLTPARRQQIAEFTEWFQRWWVQAGVVEVGRPLHPR